MSVKETSASFQEMLLSFIDDVLNLLTEGYCKEVFSSFSGKYKKVEIER
jgi:hypothetical protein